MSEGVGGVGDLVVAGQTGELVPPGDPESLAEGMRGFLMDLAKGKRFAQAGNKRAREAFDLMGMVGAYEALFEAVLVEKGGGCGRVPR
ncbi:MAG: hypothetical protein HQL52_18995 [Magnetococcales bacterium]|nr:hypothetical protein [Magnetococcales bacterium]